MKEITMYTQSVTIDLENYNGVLKIDLKEMMGLNNESEEAFIKVDEISKMFGKEPEHFFEIKQHRELMQAIMEVKSSTDLIGRTYEPILFEKSNQYEDNESSYWLEDIRYNRQWHKSHLVYRLDGRSKSMLEDAKGTYVHSDLMIDYMKWLSPKLSVLLNIKFKELVKEIFLLKKNRKATIDEFHKLVEITSRYYPPKKQGGHAGEYADVKLMDLINISVIGSKTSTFREANNIPYDDPTRKYFTPAQLEKVELCERIVCGLIEYGGFDNYKDIKAALAKKLKEK